MSGCYCACICFCLSIILYRDFSARIYSCAVPPCLFVVVSSWLNLTHSRSHPSPSVPVGQARGGWVGSKDPLRRLGRSPPLTGSPILGSADGTGRGRAEVESYGIEKKRKDEESQEGWRTRAGYGRVEWGSRGGTRSELPGRTENQNREEAATKERLTGTLSPLPTTCLYPSSVHLRFSLPLPPLRRVGGDCLRLFFRGGGGRTERGGEGGGGFMSRVYTVAESRKWGVSGPQEYR